MSGSSATDWDLEAERFDDEADHGLREPAVRQAWQALLLEHLPSAPAEVLDVGCGTGSLSVLLAEHGFRIIGIDFSTEMVERARAKAAAAAVNATFVVGDAASPRQPHAHVDVVLVRHVLWAIPDRGAALEAWAHTLKPGGRLVLVEGLWTSAGIPLADCIRLVSASFVDVAAVPLSDPALWGGPVSDERYLVTATPRSVVAP